MDDQTNATTSTATPRSMATGGLRARHGVCDLDLALDRSEPRIAVAHDGAALRGALQRPMEHCARYRVVCPVS